MSESNSVSTSVALACWCFVDEGVFGAEEEEEEEEEPTFNVPAANPPRLAPAATGEADARFATDCKKKKKKKKNDEER
jgi:hypothetical protein